MLNGAYEERLRSEENIEFAILLAYNKPMTKQDIKDIIQYEDKDLIVVAKPAGLAVESSRVTEPDLESQLRRYLASESEESDLLPELYTVHRLDQRVGGLLVFARTKKAAGHLSAQLGDGRMEKIYHAVVEGEIPSEEGTLTDYLLRDPKTNSSKVVQKTQAGGRNRPKKAILDYRKINEHTIEILLHTGRHHQIRVQLAHAGMPIRGDVKYGAAAKGSLCLAAVGLSFIHPSDGRLMKFQIKPSFEEA